MEYLNFDLEIGPGNGGDYPVTVRLPSGAVRSMMRFPFDKQTLELYLSRLETALLRSRIGRRQVLLPHEQVISDFGAALFDALIVGDVHTMYDQRRERARQQGMGVRIRLLVEAPDLTPLPWEYLRDPRQADFLCLSPQTPLVRYVKIPQPLQPLKVQPPLHLLGMVASPSDQDPLDVAGEQARLRTALQPLEAQGMVELQWVPGQTWQDLQETIWRGDWHVFHFIGHGGFDAKVDEGKLALADPQGKTHLLRGSQLGRLLANGNLRLVVLNACEGAKGSDRDLFSSAGASLVRREIPAVVAMQAEISDAAALQFTSTFYKALAYGIPVDAALAEARTAIWISIPNTLEWGTPVLYLRAPDGVLFDVVAPPPTPTGPIEPSPPSALPKPWQAANHLPPSHVPSSPQAALSKAASATPPGGSVQLHDPPEGTPAPAPSPETRSGENQNTPTLPRAPFPRSPFRSWLFACLIGVVAGSGIYFVAFLMSGPGLWQLLLLIGVFTLSGGFVAGKLGVPRFPGGVAGFIAWWTSVVFYPLVDAYVLQREFVFPGLVNILGLLVGSIIAFFLSYLGCWLATRRHPSYSQRGRR